MLNLVLFGPPGAGKGTQSSRLIAQYGLEHLSTGDIIRSEIAACSPLGLDVKALVDQGKLVPDELVIELIACRIGQNPETKGYIFDGFPRTVAQAEALDRMLASKGTAITCMLMLEVSNDELTHRLLQRAQQEGRADDTPEVIRRRLFEYTNKTLPVADFYRRQGKLFVINGVGQIDDVTKRLYDAIAQVKATTPR